MTAIDWSTWMSAVRDVLTRARIADALDIALIAAVVYAIFAWLRQARARLLATSLAVLAALYFVARALDMYLSLALVQAVLPLLVIALIVIFQEDLRRAFERLALFGPRALRVTPRNVDVLVEAAFKLAERRVGALIVLRGREPLERHQSGGIALDGRLSGPLLYSLFDPHSPGHDGAVVIEGEVIRAFAVHLPLSTALSPDQAGQRGTRHAAGLGLSEASDALVIVVSEERGEVSVARDGRLWHIQDSGQLKHELQAFVSGRHARQSAVAADRRSRLPGLLLKVFAIGLATVAWFSAAIQQKDIVVRTLELPVTYRNMPEDWLIDQPEPKSAWVTLSGPEPVIKRIDPGQLTLDIDLTEVEAGAHDVKLGAYNLELDAEVTVQRVEPDRVRVVAHPGHLRKLTVQPNLRGRLPRGRVLATTTVEPHSVEVLVATEVKSRVTHVSTAPIELGDVEQSIERKVGIVLPDGVRFAPSQSDTVTIRLDITEASRERAHIEGR